jgi:hypothetical protein
MIVVSIIISHIMPMLVSGRSSLSRTLLGDSVIFSNILLMWMNQNDDRAECLASGSPA